MRAVEAPLGFCAVVIDGAAHGSFASGVLKVRPRLKRAVCIGWIFCNIAIESIAGNSNASSVRSVRPRIARGL